MFRRTLTTASVEDLSKRGDVAGLAGAVANGDDAVRTAAVEALGASGAADAPLRVADALLTRPGQLEVADREALKRVLETAGGEAAAGSTVAHLMSQLGGPHDTRAITMLVWLAPASVQPLIDALADPRRALQAALALGYIRDAGAIEALRAHMLESPDPDMRRAAAWGLGTIGDPAAANALLVAHHRARSAAPAEQDASREEHAPPQEEDVVADPAPSFSLESLGSLDFDGLAELYDIALDAWRSAGRMGNADQEARWQAVAGAVIEEARRRPPGGAGATEPLPREMGPLNRRRLDRQRAQLREACAGHG